MKPTTERAARRHTRENLGTKQEMLEVKLAPSQVAERGEQLARAQGEMEDHDKNETSVKATLKANRARIEAEIQKLAMAVRNRAENQLVTVRVEADFAEGIAYLRRCDTGEVIRTRPVAEDERQARLPVDEPEPRGEETGEEIADRVFGKKGGKR